MSNNEEKPRINKASLSYLDEDFLNSPAGRSIRILSEYQLPRHYLTGFEVNNRCITVFGSARQLSPKACEKYPKIAATYAECELIVEKLIDWSFTLEKEKRFYICTGGGPGFMEAANKGAFNKKCPSIGLNINLPFEQHSNPYVTPSLNFEFHYFFMRKFWFTNLSRAIIVMPGGFGTMDELFEHLTLIQTKKTKRELPIVLYCSDFWNNFLNVDFLSELGFIHEQDKSIYKICDTPDECVEYIIQSLSRIHQL